MQRRGLPIADKCRAWLSGRALQGIRFIVPEIADYEVRRELLRLNLSGAVARLDAFNNALPDRYLPITTASIRRAAELWAEIRKRGVPTSHPKELDGDVIVAAQALF
jgi:predicted nucleic acid-binding protein